MKQRLSRFGLTALAVGLSAVLCLVNPDAE